MTYRFVVNTAQGMQNFLKVKERKNGDLIVSQRNYYETLNLDGFADYGLPKDSAEGHKNDITVHPNLASKNDTISINYKTIKAGKEISRTVCSALEVKKGLTLFPVLISIGSNIASPNLEINDNKDKIIYLWPDQQLDWSLQSLAYCVFVANPDTHFVSSQNFPRGIHYLNFKHLQFIFMYWIFDKPTKGAGTTFQVFNPDEGALRGFELNEAINYTETISIEHAKIYDLLPELLPQQLPQDPIIQTGVKIILDKWLFKRFTYGIETHRDESLLRLKFKNEDGNQTNVDFSGEEITKFQDALNKAIQVTPGLAVWKKPDKQ